MVIRYNGQTLGPSGLPTIPISYEVFQALSETERNREDLIWLVEGAPDIPSSEPSTWEVYSTEETPIGTWIDGKTIYRKVIHTTSPSVYNVSTVIVPETVEDTVINVNGWILTENVHVPFMTYNGPGETAISYWIEGKGFEVRLTAWKNKPCVVILEYTKKEEES